MKLLSIDPGKSYYAWAKWTDDNTLQSCGRRESEGIGTDYFSHCVIELPQVYQQRKWRGDPNDLIQVALTVGALKAMVNCLDVTLVKPHEWKGSVPKDVMGNRIVSKLSGKEKKILREGTLGLGDKKKLDVIDAVGIGLWALLRL